MEITAEIKKAIIHQYYGQRYLYKNEFGTYNDFVGGYHTVTHLQYDSFMLMLKPYTAITIGDAIEVGKMAGFSDEKMKEISKKGNVFDYLNGWNVCISIYQFLQSKGHDLPQRLLGGETIQKSGLAIYKK